MRQNLLGAEIVLYYLNFLYTVNCRLSTEFGDVAIANKRIPRVIRKSSKKIHKSTRKCC